MKQILSACWGEYCASHAVKEYQIKEVEKALDCYGHENGCFVYYCSECDEYVFQFKGCNSRVCSCCGKRYADQWAVNLSGAMFVVPHRHFVMSVPDALWHYLRDWNMMKVYMGAAIKAFEDYFSCITHQRVRVGVIVVLHSFGKDMRFQPHLHLLLTEGGFDNAGRFVKCCYVPADGFRRKWQFEVLKKLQDAGLPNEIATLMYQKYRKGFYVWLHKRGTISHPKLIARYVGRYVRHPAIANSRITSFDGKIVKFFYVDHEDKRVNVEMTAEQFITALIQHIPPPQFKMIRYYGAYARSIKRKYGAKIRSSIKQLNLTHFGFEKLEYCPYCHHKLEFVAYCKKPPPPNKEKLDFWTETYSEKTKN